MNPYENLPAKAFWRPSVAEKSFFDVSDLWNPKFNIKQTHRIVTYGSCFAQHIGRALRGRGFRWEISETAPMGMSNETAKEFNYGVFSSRTGNIYTTSLLRQWSEWAFGDVTPPEEVWVKDGRYYDPFRPRVEPNGFQSEEEVKLSRQETIKAFKEGVLKSDFFVFTLGLTESWVNTQGNYEYPMCPGTVAGEFDEKIHKFVNQDFNTIRTNLAETIRLLRRANPRLRFILTVSPVPLTATMSGNHVIVATMASKSILRAVTHQLASNGSNIDYFPSYEIINSPVFRGTFFEPNVREVNPAGVNFVMQNFFSCLEAKYGEIDSSAGPRNQATDQAAREDLVCEEELLGAFSGA